MSRRKLLGLAAAAPLLASSWPGRAAPGEGNPAPAIEPPFTVRRFPENPVIRPGMDARMRDEASRYGYVNINGPSLIRVPDWVENPLGRYYLYFAHHKGEYIRLSYADSLAGPWRTHEAGALELRDSLFPEEAPKVDIAGSIGGTWRRNPPEVAWALTRVGAAALAAALSRRRAGEPGSMENRPHIASPDVHVDEERREIRMYYHGMLADTVQMTRVAVSRDGLNFEAREQLLTSPYLRAFRYRGSWHGIGMPGILYRSADGLTGFEARPGLLFGVNLRHTAVMLRGSVLHIFFSRVGDAPERIMCSRMDLTAEDWRRWRPEEPFEVMRPETDYEGAKMPVERSLRGEITGAANQLRDPAVFEEDGRTWLLYSCAGEQAIGMAELYPR